MLGNTSFPGRDNLGASLATPPMCNFRATTPTGFSADRVATCFGQQQYCTQKRSVYIYNYVTDVRTVKIKIGIL